MSSNLFDKMKKSLDTSLTTVSAKSRETVEIIKLKGQIRDLQQRTKGELGNLGEMVYTMYKDDIFSREIIDNECRALLVIDEEIGSKEEEIEVIQIRTQSTIEATKTEIKCPSCNMSIPKGSKFCTRCSAKVEVDERKCSCGQVVDAGAKFCVGCGQKTEALAPSNFVCSQCSKPLEPSTLFCPDCGAKRITD